MNNTYELCGILNYYSEYPNVVHAVFKHDDKLYLELAPDANTILEFIEIKINEKNYLEIMSKLKLLSQIKSIVNTNTTFKLGDAPILCFQKDENNVYIGSISDTIEYMESLDLNYDEYLLSNLAYLKNEIGYKTKILAK